MTKSERFWSDLGKIYFKTLSKLVKICPKSFEILGFCGQILTKLAHSCPNFTL